MNLNFIKINFENIFIFILLFLIFFSETIILDTLIPAYLFIFFYLLINLSKIRISLFQLLSILICIFYLFCLLFLSKENSTLLVNFRYFFGFAIFLIFLRNFNFDEKHFFLFRLILFLICFYTIIEALFINIYPDISLHQEIHTAKFFGFYTRSYGVGGNSTISSLSIIFLYYFIYKFFRKKISIYENILVLFSIFSLFSTTGFIILCTIIFFENLKFKNIDNFLKFFVVVFSLFLLIYASTIIEGDHFQKISSKYLKLIIHDKLYWFKLAFGDIVIVNPEEIYFFKRYSEDILSIKECFNFFWGCQIHDTINTSGDFAIKIFIIQNGILGLFPFLLLIFSFFKSKNYLILLILISTTLHYGFVFSNIGHFILPLFLIFTFKNYSIKKYNYDK